MRQTNMTVGEEYILFNERVKLIEKHLPFPGRKSRCGVLVEEKSGRRRVVRSSWVAGSAREHDERRDRRDLYQGMVSQLNELAGIDAAAQIEPELEERGDRPIILSLHREELQQLLDALATSSGDGGDPLTELFTA